MSSQAVENFIYSCAGCCVATYVLGNLRQTQRQHHDEEQRPHVPHRLREVPRTRPDVRNIKRPGSDPVLVVFFSGDRAPFRPAPFVFTSDMAYVINGGDKPSSRFHDFVDLCCEAYNLIRKTHSPVPAPPRPAPPAVLLPRVHTARSDGVIKNLYICRLQRTNKGYMFVVKVERENESSLVSRTFEEFHELHSKLRLIFPSNKLPSFPSRFVIGRSRGEAAADRRKDELNGYVWHLLHAAPEVTQCDLVYSFFHPLPRDESPTERAAPKPALRWSPLSGAELGQIKLSISYKNQKLFIMVMHIRGLQPLPDGTDPDPYVKVYLLPDPQKVSKRKTKAARKTCNPPTTRW
ncbi:hypothetical protein WMY93_011123 [Mugilogobius chulae]|uniref:Uncharacterized protein n=1 Tax=Mugilogobius chulae TaxID=88201 RepID=A0AAW0P531_9GOBI